MGCLHIFVFPESSLLHTACLYFGVMLFSQYIVFDASMICNKLGYDDYVVAVFELYLDIIYYFLAFFCKVCGCVPLDYAREGSCCRP